MRVLSGWSQTVQSTLTRMRILVVDDDRAVRESLRRSLAFNGYQVELADDGQRGAGRRDSRSARTRWCST